MQIKLYLNRPEEFQAYSAFCLAMSAIPPRAPGPSDLIDGPSGWALAERFQTAPAGEQIATLQDLADKVAAAEAAVVASEPEVKKPGRPKKDAAAKVETKVETTTAPLAETKVETKAITLEEVRSLIIDVLNDWSAAVPNDPDIRVTTLGPILKALGAEKIGGIAPEKYDQVAGLVDDARAKLNDYLAAAEQVQSDDGEGAEE